MVFIIFFVDGDGFKKISTVQDGNIGFSIAA
jgi:hypothetical protein